MALAILRDLRFLTEFVNQPRFRVPAYTENPWASDPERTVPKALRLCRADWQPPSWLSLSSF